MSLRERYDERPIRPAESSGPEGLEARFREEANSSIQTGLAITMRSMSGDSEKFNEANTQEGGQ